MPWYKAGTVSVTAGSNAVIGVGTSFIANVRVGDGFRGPDGAWYEINNIASDTALSIATGYLGATVAGGSYSIIPVQGYVKDSADQLRAATKTLSPAVISDKARALFARPDTAGMQAELALVPVTGSTDTTAGRLLTVGYRGLGAAVLPFLGVSLNPDDYLVGGEYLGQFAMAEWAGPGTPTTNVSGWLTVAPGSSSNSCRQTFTNEANGFTFVRAKVSGVWAAWAKVFNALNSQQDPQTSLGLMSSTFVSGWTIEKFLNGAANMMGTSPRSAVIPANTVQTVEFTIPSLFVNESITTPNVSILATANADVTLMSAFATGGTTKIALQVKNGPTAQAVDIRARITGRWKV